MDWSLADEVALLQNGYDVDLDLPDNPNGALDGWPSLLFVE